MSIRRHRFPVVVVGGGEAALTAASAAIAGGHEVAVVSTASPRELTNGGFEPDPWSALAPGEIATTVWHVIDRAEPPETEAALAAAASAARVGIAHLTGLGLELPEDPPDRVAGLLPGFWPEVSAQLFAYVRDAGATFFSETRVTDVILETTPAGRTVTGVVCVDLTTGEIDVISAGCVVLATSGFVRMFRSAISARRTTGDGLAALARAGIALTHMHELVVHALGVDSGHVLPTDALARGAVITGAHGTIPADPVDPNLGIGLLRRMENGEGIGPRADYLLLDLTAMDPEAVAQTLGGLEGVIRLRTGVDPLEAPIPVRPVPSYCLGGVLTDDAGQVLDHNDAPVIGLFACDEAASVRGRGTQALGPNAYDARVARAANVGKDAARFARDHRALDTDDAAIVEQRRTRLAQYERTDVAALDAWTAALHAVMTADVLAQTDANAIARVRATLDEISDETSLPRSGANPVDDPNVLLELEDLLTLARTIAHSAETGG